MALEQQRNLGTQLVSLGIDDRSDNNATLLLHLPRSSQQEQDRTLILVRKPELSIEEIDRLFLEDLVKTLRAIYLKKGLPNSEKLKNNITALVESTGMTITSLRDPQQIELEKMVINNLINDAEIALNDIEIASQRAQTLSTPFLEQTRKLINQEKSEKIALLRKKINDLKQRVVFIEAMEQVISDVSNFSAR